MSASSSLRLVTDQDANTFHLSEEPHAESSTLLGFWIYLMSDCFIFAVLFATYGVLGRNYAGGPTGADLFELPTVAVNTGLLLFSSITYGMAMIAAQGGKAKQTLAWLAVTGLFGCGFLTLELTEFAHLIGHGSYELAFRDPALYAWLLGQSCRKCDRPLPPWRPLAAYENDGGDNGASRRKFGRPE